MAAGRHGPGICKCVKHQTRDTLYRKDFLALIGPGPHQCAGCGEDLMFADGEVDHKDNNRKNNDPSNWQLMHKPCHARKSRQDDSPEVRAAHSDRFRALNEDPGIRAARSDRAKQQHADGRLGRAAKRAP